MFNYETSTKCFFFFFFLRVLMQDPRLSCSSNDKESACNAGHSGSIPGSGGSPGGGTGNPLQYSCLESSTDRVALQATVHGVAKSQMTEHNSKQLGNKRLLKSRALIYKSHQMAFAFLLRHHHGLQYQLHTCWMS